ncbi:MAG TPA: hypothetical protein DEF47_11140 [Herpetosiphon sp.]|uniref:Uncharacterized protein n=1 Tax=Herpetosiphon aurantiacus (strain ATCC 23779 / DSM 785 / 114-95) TaxID=316274 RepID=A9AXU3_HERA2|nr:hypothetical protein [Herpetosiphon sp.]ABX04909.1 hypothetical protein Haur_2269 [Herpetosiphon aurantiacus DSM 785]HBW50450.1 hypothetical protein [Herpetosiphon sp.]
MSLATIERLLDAVLPDQQVLADTTAILESLVQDGSVAVLVTSYGGRVSPLTIPYPVPLTVIRKIFQRRFVGAATWTMSAMVALGTVELDHGSIRAQYHFLDLDYTAERTIVNVEWFDPAY